MAGMQMTNTIKGIFKTIIISFMICCLGLLYSCKYDCDARTVSVSAGDSGKSVYCGGFPVGIYIKTDGVMVISISDIRRQDGMISSPCLGNIMPGDYITYVNGVRITKKKQLSEQINNCSGQPVTLHVIRDNKEIEVSVNPVMDDAGVYRLGIWVRDDAQGIGAVTFIKEDGTFGALGHPISDSDTGKKVEVLKGGLYKTHIQTIIKSSSGNPGSFSGIICYDESTFMGNIHENGRYGIYGVVSKELLESLKGSQMIETVPRSMVNYGDVIIRCSLDGRCSDYTAKIIKMDREGRDSSFVVEVTDERLIERTGGIIQGMSGSPIIQDGRLVGAVTHVFVNDPEKGYGIFIENMLESIKEEAVVPAER